MTALIVGTYTAFAWLILWSIRNMRADRQRLRHRQTFIARHQRDIRYDQLGREVDESRIVSRR